VTKRVNDGHDKNLADAQQSFTLDDNSATSPESRVLVGPPPRRT
jgi:hypothetical protein